jgi:hypothetical protein
MLHYIGCKLNLAKVLLGRTAIAYLIPVSPLQSESLVSNHRYLWLERGVKDRGDFAPSHILFPSRTNINSSIYNKSVQEGDTGGEYKNIKRDANEILANFFLTIHNCGNVKKLSLKWRLRRYDNTQ